MPVPARRASLLLLALLAAPAAADETVRDVTGADEARAVFGVTGRGVTIAILDRGIDWRHPDFIDDDGATRIRALLDMTGQSGCPGAPAPAEWSAADLDAALRGGPDVPSRDAVGHGTATAGLAAGNGRAFADGRYAGLAPEADLLVVKLTSEGAPAHGGEAAESAFQGCLDDALAWLDARIDELGQPCVAIVNSGTQWGPIDGTSAASRAIDEVFGPDRPGRVMVVPSGDEGTLPSHAGTTFETGRDAVIPFQKVSTATTFGQLWYSGAHPATVTVSFASGASVGPVAPNQFLEQSGIAVVNYLPGTEFHPWTSTSGDRAVWIRIVGQAGPGTITLSGLGGPPATVDAYGDLLGPDLTPILQFTDHLAPGRLTDFASTPGAIVVGCSVARTQWVDVDGIVRVAAAEGTTGALWLKSAGGPTRDGRVHGVDVVAPGHNAFAALGQSSWWSAFDSIQVQDGGGWYARFGATSAAAPVAVGAVALMLQRNPSLTADEIRQILRNAARTDGFTGATPSAAWGFGKLDVLAAVAATPPARPGDVDLDGIVGVADLLAVLGAWGPCPSPCAEDADLDGAVGVLDLLAVLGAWSA